MVPSTPASQPSACPNASPLRGDFGRCEILSRDAECLVLRLEREIDDGDEYLRAHFPGFTVFPGVFLLEVVTRAVARACDPSDADPPVLSKVRSMRFVAPLLAGQTLAARISITGGEVEGDLDVDAACARSDGTAVARLKLSMRPISGFRA